MATMAYELVSREKTPTLSGEDMHVSGLAKISYAGTAGQDAQNQNHSLVGVLELGADRHGCVGG